MYVFGSGWGGKCIKMITCFILFTTDCSCIVPSLSFFICTSKQSREVLDFSSISAILDLYISEISFSILARSWSNVNCI